MLPQPWAGSRGLCLMHVPAGTLGIPLILLPLTLWDSGRGAPSGATPMSLGCAFCLCSAQHSVMLLLSWPLRAAVVWTGVGLGGLEMGSTQVEEMGAGSTAQLAFPFSRPAMGTSQMLGLFLMEHKPALPVCCSYVLFVLSLELKQAHLRPCLLVFWPPSPAALPSSRSGFLPPEDRKCILLLFWCG